MFSIFNINLLFLVKIYMPLRMRAIWCDDNSIQTSSTIQAKTTEIWYRNWLENERKNWWKFKTGISLYFFHSKNISCMKKPANLFSVFYISYNENLVTWHKIIIRLVIWQLFYLGLLQSFLFCYYIAQFHMWVGLLIGSLLCFKSFSLGTLVFVPPQKSISKFQFI